MRQHLACPCRMSLSFSKAVQMHDKVIGYCVNIKRYQ
ncbi:hypothetical protein H0516_21150 [Pantoea stewartii]|nr:hypothetical protein [Pantoea stewartii]